MPQNPVKLIDIAEKLEVSVGLVSIVLSGKSKERRISDKLTKKVIETAKDLGYMPNQLARGLRTGKSGILALLLADISNPFFGKLARHIENEAAKLGYHLMFGSSDENPKKLENLINVFMSRQVDGMIIVPVAQSDSYLSKLREQSIPHIFIDRYCKDLKEDAIVSNNYEGSFQLTNLLINNGYKKIGAFVHNLQLSNITERINGFKSALQDSELNYDIEDSIFKINFEDPDSQLKKKIEQALEQGCDSFFFANNELGIKSLKYFNKIGLNIPNDIGMVSFDNPEAFQLTKTGISCFEQDIELMSAKAVNILIEKIQGNSHTKPEQITLPGKLIIQNSSDKKLLMNEVNTNN